jgi:hypothetical protein
LAVGFDLCSKSAGFLYVDERGVAVTDRGVCVGEINQ